MKTAEAPADPEDAAAGQKKHADNTRKSTRRIIFISLAAIFALFSIFVCLHEIFGGDDAVGWRGIYSSLGLGKQSVGTVESGSAAVHFIDVGQGDCALICINGKNVLIDCGEYDQYSTVAAYLKNHGVTRLDWLIMSHPHSDHMGCMYRIAGRYDTGALIMPDIPEDMLPVTSSYIRLMDIVEDNDIPIIYAVPGTRLDLDENSFIDIIAPVAKYDDLNNFSDVVKFTHGEVSFLFCGDIEEQAELDILAGGADISADVIKSAHHGSSSSSTRRFMQAVSPEYAVFCCGQENSYGHPHASVVRLYEKLSIKMYRTDRDGDIVFLTDGTNISVTTEKGGA